ncbi:hypothetical protein CROQUDRAFT_107720 [Cronartium quercuum f. sp. fusiforme G11]|uniref:Uncharacterized protein n=1 Tax=Cronartium quercuum f. sp. fusiforme G11 TaxID=708437 RepID=A0A9P6NEW1_9BASI|nr:hypothetical protein CROQUDRAFT_107720 [Cronartium quercuum f. sp. fusiforme G11]
MGFRFLKGLKTQFDTSPSDRLRMVSHSISGQRLKSPPSRLFSANLEPSMPSANFKPSMGYVRVVGPLVAGRDATLALEPRSTSRFERSRVQTSNQIEAYSPTGLMVTSFPSSTVLDLYLENLDPSRVFDVRVVTPLLGLSLIFWFDCFQPKPAELGFPFRTPRLLPNLESTGFTSRSAPVVYLYPTRPVRNFRLPSIGSWPDFPSLNTRLHYEQIHRTISPSDHTTLFPISNHTVLR